MRTQQRKQNTILYTILTLSILLAASSLIYAIYSNHQLTEQTNDLEYTTTLINIQINKLKSDIADLSLQVDSATPKSETKAQAKSETKSNKDTATTSKPIEQKEPKPAKEAPATTTKPATNDVITESYTITAVDILEDESKGFEATSNETPDGSMSFTGDSVENSSQFKVGDRVIAEFDND
ncbi:MAG: hypothetical protein ACI383_13090 [Rummeliibacillus sp.]